MVLVTVNYVSAIYVMFVVHIDAGFQSLATPHTSCLYALPYARNTVTTTPRIVEDPDKDRDDPHVDSLFPHALVNAVIQDQ